MTRRPLAAAALALAGCLELAGPDVGPAQQTACDAVDSDPDTDVSFAGDVLDDILDRRCASCHTPGGDTPIGITRGGLELSTYATLREGGARSGADVVVDGDPCASVLIQKLRAPPPFGDRMPLDEAALSVADQQTFTDWILEGALDN